MRKKNLWAVEMAKLRAKKLGPQRCHESAKVAAAASAIVRSAKAKARKAAEAQADEELEPVSA